MEDANSTPTSSPESSTPAEKDPEAQPEVKTRGVEVQFTVKWVNFTYTVEDATSGVDAVDRALASYEEHGFDEFTITAGNEECSDLDRHFLCCQGFHQSD